MIATIATAFLSFFATNVDDIFLLTIFFGQGIRPGRVVLGQYLGFGALIVVSLSGYFMRFVIPGTWLGLLALLPIAIGLRKLWLSGRDEPGKTVPLDTSILTVATVTFSNGGDNIGIYVPLFAASDFSRLTIIIAVFLLLLAVWCLAGYFLGGLPIVRKSIGRYGRIVVPVVLIGLGIKILLDSGTLQLLR